MANPSGLRFRRDEARAAPKEPPPWLVAPMQASLGPAPPLDDPQWAYQTCWPGLRVTVHLHADPPALPDRKVLRITDPDGVDVAGRLPELAGLVTERDRHPRVLDAVIVAVDGDEGWSEPVPPRTIDLRAPAPVHRLNPTGIAYRLAAQTPADARSRIAVAPVRLVLLDIIHTAGRRVGDLPHATRRRLLRAEVPDGPAWSVVTDHTDAGAALRTSLRQWGITSLVAKRLDSRYFPGLESNGWVRLDFPVRTEVTVVGWERAAQGGRIDGLLVAARAADGTLQFVGTVPVGRADALRERLAAQVARLAADHPPPLRGAAPPPDVPNVRWLQPELTVSVAATARADDGSLVHPVLLDVASTLPRSGPG